MFAKKLLYIKTSIIIAFIFFVGIGSAIATEGEKKGFEHSKISAREKFYKDFIEKSDLNSGLVAAYDSLISIAYKKNEIEDVCLWQISKAEILNTLGQYSSSFLESKKTISLIDSFKLARKPSFLSKKMDCLYNMAKMSLNLGFYDQSVNYLLDILSFNKEANQNIRAYSLLSLLFINMDKPQIAENYINKAKELLSTPNQKIDTLTYFIFHNHLGGVLYAKKQYSESIAEMSKAEAYAKGLMDESNLLVVYLNLSNIYLSLEENSLALSYLSNILEICEGKTNYLHALAAQNAAYVYFLNGQYSLALPCYQKALDLAQKIDAKKLISYILIEMSDVYKELNDYKTAWEFQKKGYQVKDSVMNTKALEEIMIQTSNFEQRQEKLERQILTQKLLVNKLNNRNKTILLIILVIVLIIFIILLIVILKRLIIQQKNNKNLNQTISSIENNTKQEFLHSTQKLNEDLDYKNRELTSTSLLLIKANEMVGILKALVKKLKLLKLDDSTKEIVSEIESALNSHNMDQSWQEFKLYFEQVHPNFFAVLTTICPDLSQSEQRTCALIFLNFSTKEIASITHRSPRTVETIIYQIRKKLNIPSDEKTLNYFQHILRKDS